MNIRNKIILIISLIAISLASLNLYELHLNIKPETYSFLSITLDGSVTRLIREAALTLSMVIIVLHHMFPKKETSIVRLVKKE